MSSDRDLVAPPTAAAPHLARLNPVQLRAVEAIDGPCWCSPGGTGKTSVLTARLAHILVQRRAFPSQILAVTFTNKAAREMRARLEAMIGGRAAEGLWLGTFHSIAARLVRRHAELVGLKPNFTILGRRRPDPSAEAAARRRGLDEKRWPGRALSALIQRWKDRGLTPDKVPAAEIGDFANGRILALYRAYQERLAILNAVDFGDLTLHNLSLFTGQREVLEEYQRRFRYVLVDEYQDTNVSQYLWLRPPRPGAPQPLLRRRRRPVDLQLARRGDRQHPQIREGFPRRAGHPPRAELPLDAAYPRRRRRPHRA